MQVVAAKLGTQLMDASLSDAVEPGSWRWLAAQDPSVPSGRIRLFLSDLDAVTQLMNAVHGRAIQLGGDFIRIAVHNDLLDSASGSGNGQRGQATRGPAPAQQTMGPGRAPHDGGRLPRA